MPKFSAKHGRWSCEAICAHKALNYRRTEALTINVAHTIPPSKENPTEKREGMMRKEKEDGKM